MKRILYLLLVVTLLAGTGMSTQSCSRKSGCPGVEKPKTKRNGELKSRKAKTNLFPKKARRRGK